MSGLVIVCAVLSIPLLFLSGRGVVVVEGENSAKGRIGWQIEANYYPLRPTPPPHSPSRNPGNPPPLLTAPGSTSAHPSAPIGTRLTTLRTPPGPICNPSRPSHHSTPRLLPRVSSRTVHHLSRSHLCTPSKHPKAKKANRQGKISCVTIARQICTYMHPIPTHSNPTNSTPHALYHPYRHLCCKNANANALPAM